MAIDDHRITDEAAFVGVTTERQIAGAYFYLQLDCLVTHAYQVACDFFRRPHLYTKVNGQAEKLAKLRAQYGNNEKVPSQEQRDEIFLPLFGQSGTGLANEHGDFPRLRDELVDAAAAFAERVYDTGVDMLRERVRTTHRPFKDYLVGLQGESLVWSTDTALKEVTRELAYPILRNPGVSSVFGISTSPQAQWPFAQDSNADKLMEEISKQLLAPTNAYPAITRESISNRQRAALRGADALATILDYTEQQGDEADLKLLISKCYTWGAALKGLVPRPLPV